MVPIGFALIIGLWWARVVMATGVAWGLGASLALIAALAALVLAVTWGRRFVSGARGTAPQFGRGFLALGLSFAVGALPLAFAVVAQGEQAGASAAGGSNPFGVILTVPLVPILAGNLVAGVMLGLAAGAAVLCLVLAAVFGIDWRRDR
ncbi:hypothetical protein [Acidimangrovimonas pyrenivorans]|uniref:Uncharacterized protein n=1 Tax=Acidimangrovimonas pyrenivorans TaxID=2030798 RepID=A0ABV7AM17_9RHOB